MQSMSPGRDLVVGLFVLLGLGAMVYLSVQVGGTAVSGRKYRPICTSSYICCVD